MPCVHEFGLIDDFDKQKSYINYNPEQYNCIAVEDDLIQSLQKNLSIMKTYFVSYIRPEFGLAYWGITIIPPESLSIFYDAVTTSRYFNKSDELSELASLIIQASEEKKYMIHYGI